MAAPPSLSASGLSPSSLGRKERSRASWSRSGCLTCKKRRKKCDEKKPKCDNCTRLGRECEGYGTLWLPALSTSTAILEQENPRPKRRKVSISQHEERAHASCDNETKHALAQPNRRRGQDDKTLLIYAPDCVDSQSTNDISTMIPSTYNIAWYSPIFQDSEAFYLQYHAELGSQLLANVEYQRNHPLNEVLIPRALSSPLLLNALCALSACHMSNRTSINQDVFRSAEMTYYGKTLSGVRRALASLSQEIITSPAGFASLEEVIATIASLCKYESVRGSVRSWRGHMEALQRLVDSCGGLVNLDRGIADWLSGLLTYWQHMASLVNPTLKQTPSFCESIYKCPKIDLYLGCSEQILKVCSRIADLRRTNDFTLLHWEVIDINEYLTNWSCRDQSFIVPEGITEAAVERLKVVADCFRYAAFIFLHSILDRMAWPSRDSSAISCSHNPATEPEYQPMTWVESLHSVINFSKSSALQEMILLLQSHPPDNHSEFSALTFPLFIAGCECGGPNSNNQFSWILEALRTLEQNFGVRNTKRAQELIESYWASQGSSGKRRRHWLDVLEDMDWDLLLV